MRNMHPGKRQILFCIHLPKEINQNSTKETISLIGPEKTH